MGTPKGEASGGRLPSIPVVSLVSVIFLSLSLPKMDVDPCLVHAIPRDLSHFYLYPPLASHGCAGGHSSSRICNYIAAMVLQLPQCGHPWHHPDRIPPTQLPLIKCPQLDFLEILLSTWGFVPHPTITNTLTYYKVIIK